MRFVIEPDPQIPAALQFTYVDDEGNEFVLNSDAAMSFAKISSYEEFKKLASLGGAAMQASNILINISESLAAIARRYPDYMGRIVVEELTKAKSKPKTYLPFNPGSMN